MQPKKMTPMLEQYFSIKKKHPDCLLFYRLGDFYEMFFDDAVIASNELSIVLTSRSKMADDYVPMCGIPFHSYENYLVRLVKAGYKVAICEQIETPEEAKKRGAGAIVMRDVVRIITPGTLMEDSLLNAKQNNFLMALNFGIDTCAIAWADMSAGLFQVQTVDIKLLNSVISRLEPAEILLPENYNDYDVDINHTKHTVLQKDKFLYDENEKVVKDFYCLNTIHDLPELSRLEITSAGVIVDYMLKTQCGTKPYLALPQKFIATNYMQIDAFTCKSLELLSSLADNKNETSVLKTIDFTKTGAGGRLLSHMLSTPLLDVVQINNRLDKVNFFVDESFVLTQVQDILKQIPDIDRALSRVLLGNGGPRDMQMIATGLKQIPYLRNVFSKTEIPESLAQDLILLGNHSDLQNQLESALVEDACLLTRDGGFIKRGYSDALDDVVLVKEKSKQIIAQLQQKYAEKTGVSNLKIVFNNMIGYFVEVPTRFADNMLNDKSLGFIHRQTMVNVMRFTTVELTELESKITHADELAKQMEIELFNQLKDMIESAKTDIFTTSHAIACIDVACSLAGCATKNHWIRPQLTQDVVFDVKKGRHPVVEKSLQKSQKNFVSNNCNLSDDDSLLWLLTGPNMAGKSTFLRQNALLAILAQMGSYIPAESATIGIVDKIFSRVGASDDLARGRSTFMVEMVEVAAILNGATEKSFVILDEVGRGTATFDGLSIAWAVVEHLHNINKCRTLFATHYHELTALTNRLDKISIHTMCVKEWQGDIIFLHEVGAGAIDRSYGIHVGKLAGLPDAVLTRATQILEQLEEKKQAQKPLFDDLPLFSNLSNPISTQKDMQNDKVIDFLTTVNVDNLTPRDALDCLYQLKELMEKK